MNMISLIFKKVYFVHCCIYIYIQSLLYFYLAQEHLFYEYAAKLFFRTNFDEKFQTEPHCGASSGTAEGVGHKGTSPGRYRLTLFRGRGGGITPTLSYRLVSTIFWAFHRACSAEQQQTTKTQVLVIHTQGRRKV